MQDYNTIIGSIQMRLNGCQTRSVMDRYKIGSGTLNLIMSRYHANGIPIEELRMMAPKEVENLFYPQKNLQRKDVPLPDFQYYYDRIHAPGSRMNISFCWLDYKEKNPDGYEKSQFYEYFNRFIAENYGGQKVSMAVNRIPGEKMYIDWVGDQPELLTDTETGEIKKVHIFATTLGVSSLIYAEAFPNEKLPCFIEGCAHAVSFYGAVTKYFVPDNLRTAVTRHTKDELILQSTFADLEDFYETIVLPPPARKPKGKPMDVMERSCSFVDEAIYKDEKLTIVHELQKYRFMQVRKSLDYCSAFDAQIEKLVSNRRLYILSELENISDNSAFGQIHYETELLLDHAWQIKRWDLGIEECDRLLNSILKIEERKNSDMVIQSVGVLKDKIKRCKTLFLFMLGIGDNSETEVSKTELISSYDDPNYILGWCLWIFEDEDATASEKMDKILEKIEIKLGS